MVDYTVPDVIHDMVDLYIKHKTPFVMGTTGGNRAQILADVQAADLYAVIAPQMGKQVRVGDVRAQRTGFWACCQDPA
jgi:4-hydroxy-tetrahydrodipicolinate reductase